MAEAGPRYVLERTAAFQRWLTRLRDPQAVVAVDKRLDRLAHGVFGDSKHVAQGVHELRLHIGPGYRIYYMIHADVLCVLLCAGDKSSQRADIDRAIAMAEARRRDLEGDGR